MIEIGDFCGTLNYQYMSAELVAVGNGFLVQLVVTTIMTIMLAGYPIFFIYLFYRLFSIAAQES